MEKFIGQAKDREITYNYCHGQNRANCCQLRQIWIVSRPSFTPLPVQHSCPFFNVVRGTTNFTDGLISCGLHWIHTSPIPHLPCPFLWNQILLAIFEKCSCQFSAWIMSTIHSSRDTVHFSLLLILHPNPCSTAHQWPKAWTTSKYTALPYCYNLCVTILYKDITLETPADSIRLCITAVIFQHF